MPLGLDAACTLSPREVYFVLPRARAAIKKRDQIERCSKGQFFRNTAYLERGMPYFAFVDTNAVLVRKIDEL